MDTTQRRTRFRQILAGDKCFVPASVFDAISARIAEDLGFECGVMMGTYSSLAVLGAPDINLLTAPELAAQCLRICRAGTLPLIVDADHGFGSALNALRAVEELERAGVAALTIEDTMIPSPHGAGEKTTLVGIDEAVGRLKAALAGRSDPNLVIFGRTGAVASGGIDEAVARAKAYQAAGADGIFFAPKTRDHIAAMAASVSIPLMLGSIAPDLVDPPFLAAHRVRVYLQGHYTYGAAIQAIHNTMKAIRAGTPGKDLPGIASAELVKQITRAADYQRWSSEFL